MYKVVKNKHGESISKTANGISELHREMERELEDLEVLVMNTDGMEIFRTYGAYFLNQVEYITFKEMEKMRAEDLRAIMKFYVELIITAQSSYYFSEPELEDQVEHITLITKYRIMLKHTNRKNMENCLELQKKFSKDHISGVVRQEYLKQEPEKVTNLDISSFEKKSKRESSDLITLAIEKSDKQGLNC